MQAHSLRQSFQQLVVNHQVQSPSSNQSHGRRPARRQNRSGFGGVPSPLAAPFSPAPGPAYQPWGLQAVRADQATEATDTGTIQLIADLTRRVDAEHAAALERNAYVPGSYPVPDSELRRKVLASIVDLQAGLLERETEVRLMLLAALCGEHLLLLGPPGTAKSELSRRLAKLTGGKYFERLLTRFSVPEELFGPLSLKGRCIL